MDNSDGKSKVFLVGASNDSTLRLIDSKVNGVADSSNFGKKYSKEGLFFGVSEWDIEGILEYIKLGAK